MKVNGNGQGKVLSQDELRLLFTSGFRCPGDKALFGICLFTGCRVSEALALQTTDIKGGMLTFRKSITKGKFKTRVVDIQPGLVVMLADYQPPKPGFLFPARRPSQPLTRFMADKILKEAYDRISLVGIINYEQSFP